MIECEKCAAEVAEESTVCPECGAPITVAVEEIPAPQASKTGKNRLLLIGVVAVGVLGVLLFLAWMGTRKGKEMPPNAPPQISFEELRAKAEQGDAESEKNLGKLYARGEQVAQSYAEAAKWYRQAAEQENAGAQIALGELYEAGRGVPHDDAEVAKWYRRAAESGNPDGQYRLAVLYVMGQGVAPDNVEALKWYRKAADGGLALAQYNLGMRYCEGKAVTPDPIEAYKWLTLAGAQGIPDADRALEVLRGRMNREQIDEAKRRVKAFAIKKAV